MRVLLKGGPGNGLIHDVPNGKLFSVLSFPNPVPDGWESRTVETYPESNVLYLQARKDRSKEWECWPTDVAEIYGETATKENGLPIWESCNIAHSPSSGVF